MLAQTNWDQLITVTAPKLSGQKLGALVSGGGSFTGLYIFALFFAGILLLLYLLYGGLMLMTSRGDPKAIESAKKIITNALLGFIIIFVAYWIVQFIGLSLGLKGITSIFQ